jgi:hypothetical protein
MSEHTSCLIPPPQVIRRELSRHITEGRLLRELLRLSERAVEARLEVQKHRARRAGKEALAS